MHDLIERQAAIKTLEKGLPSEPLKSKYTEGITVGFGLAITWIEQLPSAQPETHEERTETHACDLISRQAAIDHLKKRLYETALNNNTEHPYYEEIADNRVDIWLNELPSAQPERTCVNCGRTVNNGGWYADGRTRCPIEEHYALPKDGYCHLWEKRNVTDDDYPERREK